jgi:hypothetical protein
VVELLEDPDRSSMLAVALATELSVSETLDLEGRVETALGRPLDAVVVNGVLPRRFSADEIERVTSANGAVAPAVAAAARRQHGQGGVQRNQLARLRRHVEAPVATLPLVAAPRLELDDVRELARRL